MLTKACNTPRVACTVPTLHRAKHDARHDVRRHPGPGRAAAQGSATASSPCLSFAICWSEPGPKYMLAPPERTGARAAPVRQSRRPATARRPRGRPARRVITGARVTPLMSTRPWRPITRLWRLRTSANHRQRVNLSSPHPGSSEPPPHLGRLAPPLCDKPARISPDRAGLHLVDLTGRFGALAKLAPSREATPCKASTWVVIIAVAAFLAGLFGERLRARPAPQAWRKRRWRRVKFRGDVGEEMREWFPSRWEAAPVTDPAEQLRLVMGAEFEKRPLLSRSEAQVLYAAERAINTAADLNWRVMAQVSWVRFSPPPMRGPTARSTASALTSS